MRWRENNIFTAWDPINTHIKKTANNRSQNKKHDTPEMKWKFGKLFRGKHDF